MDAEPREARVRHGIHEVAHEPARAQPKIAAFDVDKSVTGRVDVDARERRDGVRVEPLRVDHPARDEADGLLVGARTSDLVAGAAWRERDHLVDEREVGAVRASLGREARDERVRVDDAGVRREERRGRADVGLLGGERAPAHALEGDAVVGRSITERVERLLFFGARRDDELADARVWDAVALAPAVEPTRAVDTEPCFERATRVVEARVDDLRVARARLRARRRVTLEDDDAATRLRDSLRDREAHDARADHGDVVVEGLGGLDEGRVLHREDRQATAADADRLGDRAWGSHIVRGAPSSGGRARAWRRARIALALAIPLSCNDSPEPTPEPAHVDPTARMLEAATGYAVELCAAIAECQPGLFGDEFGDVDTCVARSVPQVVRSRFPEGSNTQPEDVEACTRAIDFSCPSFLALRNERSFPEVCYTPGALPKGAACLFDRQCESLFCELDATTGYACGTCGVRRAAGESCDQGFGCEAGLGCQGQSDGPPICVPFVERGEPCGAGIGFCHTDDACIDGACAPRLGEGSACDPAAGVVAVCALRPVLLGCSLAGRCTAVEHAALGEACHLPSDDVVSNCTHGSKCRVDVPGQTVGTCAPTIEDDQLCVGSYQWSGPCAAPAYCFEGICRIPDAAACAAGGVVP
ncbi:MAG: hypothetical protein U0271_08305 [Polyangiaceae bacterium]